MRISDWSSDVCSSDLRQSNLHSAPAQFPFACWPAWSGPVASQPAADRTARGSAHVAAPFANNLPLRPWHPRQRRIAPCSNIRTVRPVLWLQVADWHRERTRRSEEHTSELQSLMRISYAVFCL